MKKITLLGVRKLFLEGEFPKGVNQECSVTLKCSLEAIELIPSQGDGEDEEVIKLRSVDNIAKLKIL